MKREVRKQHHGFSLVEVLCWLAVVVVILSMTAPTLRSFGDTFLVHSEGRNLRYWLEGEMARADRSSRSRTFFLVSPRLLKAQYSDRPYEVEEFRLEEDWAVTMARNTGLSLASVVYQPVVHTVTPAFTLTVRQKKAGSPTMKIIVSGRGALRSEEVRRIEP